MPTNHLGFAQKRFLSEIKKPFSFKNHINFKTSSWPYVDDLLERGCLSYIDYLLAKKLLKETEDENVALFVCHLELALRCGNPCIYVDASKVLPEVKDVWRPLNEENSLNALNVVEEAELQRRIILGATNLPDFLMSEDASALRPICKVENRYYLQRYWIYEKKIKEELNRRNEISSKDLDFDFLHLELENLKKKDILLDQQAKAIFSACKNKLTFVCGGPGTGKTYTASYLIKLIMAALPQTRRENFKIAITAPTGKAAANLQNGLKRVLGEAAFDIKGKTLHSLLGIYDQKTTSQKVLNEDLVIVDECSMVDMHVMAQLLSSLKPEARLVLLGDPDQLPPISVGKVFEDMIRLFPQQVVRLSSSMRTDSKVILNFSFAIKNGDHAQALNMLNLEQNALIKKDLPRSHPHHIQEMIVKEYASQFLFSNFAEKDLFQAMNRFRILSTLRKGPFGVDRLNELMLKWCLQKQSSTDVALPIVLVGNDYKRQLFNGEAGILMRKNENDGYALFINQEMPNELRKIPFMQLPRFEYGFCLSVHKSQGSEFDHVVLFMPEGSEIFGREILYTAVTRARKKLEIWGNDSTFVETIQKKAQRLSGMI